MVARDLSPWLPTFSSSSFPPGGRTRFNSRASSALRAEEEERKMVWGGFPSRGSKPLATNVRPPGEESRVCSPGRRAMLARDLSPWLPTFSSSSFPPAADDPPPSAGGPPLSVDDPLPSAGDPRPSAGAPPAPQEAPLAPREARPAPQEAPPAPQEPSPDPLGGSAALLEAPATLLAVENGPEGVKNGVWAVSGHAVAGAE